ncbi:hypothetical protein GQ53DRAFT_751106 [Thozetella sp. PMI_491]|nr:hypothetical protein GQ53DRAFT_751106 [Thozetella sp. PMI_491]
MGEPMSLGASDVVFAEANPAQRQQSWELSGALWAAPLSVGDYVAREQHLAEQDLTKDGGCKYWVLHLLGYPSLVIASCETTHKTVLISENGHLRQGRAYAIASVFTNPTYRRMGMAPILLRKVREFMDTDGQADFSVLYSDVGRSYYADMGWAAFPRDQATLQLLPPSPPGGRSPPKPGQPTFLQTRPGRSRYLTLDELQPLCEADEKALRTHFETFQADGKTHIAFLPTFAQMSWQLARSEFMATKLFGEEVEVVNRGAAITGDGGAGPPKAWIYWDHDWRDRKLKVLRIVIAGYAPDDINGRADAIRVLLEAALAEASSWGLSKVMMWNPDEHTKWGCKAVGNAHEDVVKVVFEVGLDASIPSLRWKGGKRDARRTVWEENYYYCWC